MVLKKITTAQSASSKSNHGQSSPRQLTEAELAAARLRKMAGELLLQADALEASVAVPATTRRKAAYADPLTGKPKKIRFIGLND